MKTLKIISIAGALLAIAGCWLPWVKLGDDTLNGFLQKGDSGFNNNLVDFGGFIVIALSVLSLGFSLLKKFWAKIIGAVFSLFIPAVSYLKFREEKKLLGFDGKDLQLGIGFWLILIGSALIVGSCLQGLRNRK